DVCSRIKALGRQCTAVRADVSSASDVSRLVETVRRELGTVTILVNNAGIARTHTLNDITEQDWDSLMNVNLKAAFLVTQSVVSGMLTARWGRIINISSAAAQMGGVVGPHYAASKAGLIGLTHYYASHLAKEGITVNTIAPGPVRSEMSANLPQLNPSMVPVGRFGEPEEVATVAVLLALNGYITGQTINVNGGRYMS
ncbi:MAG TPA: SDR family oxidoreductase, partial [Nitrospirota bacterium]|nr:SDR family oxidoreductase [Nitrospirota bacterium]